MSEIGYTFNKTNRKIAAAESPVRVTKKALTSVDRLLGYGKIPKRYLGQSDSSFTITTDGFATPSGKPSEHRRLFMNAETIRQSFPNL